jgi:hypothetical protein
MRGVTSWVPYGVGTFCHSPPTNLFTSDHQRVVVDRTDGPDRESAFTSREGSGAASDSRPRLRRLAN